MTITRSPEPLRLVVAGRTDAGVHATGQVAHVDADIAALAVKTPADLLQKLRRILSSDPDIAIHGLTVAAEGFDARFSAVARRYEYRMQDRPERVDPIDRRRVVSWPRPLDRDAMNAAATSLQGLRDFGTFCKPRPDATTIRDLQEFRWHEDVDGVLIATLRADAFCHSMVRALVGACVAVGEGKLDVTELCELRDAAARTSRFKVLPPHGLCLTEVFYPPDAELGARAEQTRGKRDLAGNEVIP